MGKPLARTPISSQTDARRNEATMTANRASAPPTARGFNRHTIFLGPNYLLLQ
jgi:hypothetical protein